MQKTGQLSLAGAVLQHQGKGNVKVMEQDLGFVNEWYLKFEHLLDELYFPGWLARGLAALAGILAIVICAVVLYYLISFVAVKVFAAYTRRTKNTWDDKILNRRVIQRIAHLVPAIVVYVGSVVVFPPSHDGLIAFLRIVARIYMLFAAVLAVNAFLMALHDIYMELPISKNRPIKPYVQLVQIIMFLFAGIVVISIIVGKSPSALLLGMSAMAAVLMLVFKDPILGLVASVQASANNLVKPGDWIVMPTRDANGTVLEITLTSVRVQNWDRTIVTFPTYALVSESCTNWKGMSDSDGRRIKRSINIDARSVHFCTEEELDRFENIELIRDYVREARREICEQNEAHAFAGEVRINGRGLTNIGVFRKYVAEYLLQNPNMSHTGDTMCRQMQPTTQGIPLEVYCFSAIKSWVEYEGVQSDLFDHLYAIIPRFNLLVFQDFSGSDVRSIMQSNAPMPGGVLTGYPMPMLKPGEGDEGHTHTA